MERNLNWAAQLFLVLFPAAVGCLLGSLILDPQGGIRFFVTSCATVALVFAVVGAAAPVLRIKKPLRSYRMLTGVGHSPLSRQAVLVSLFLLVLVVHWALVLAGMYALWLGILAVVIGAAAVLAAGLTYQLGSQPAWRHWSTFLTLFAGLLALGVSTSLVIALGWRDVLVSGTAAGIATRVLVLVGVAGLGAAAWGWTRYLKKAGPRAAEAQALIQGEYRNDYRLGVFLAVLVAGVTAAVSFASSWLIIVAFVSLLIGLFLARRLFFVVAVPLNWKSEVRLFALASAAGKER